jgi:large subunit ribosomal protein L4
MQADVLNIQGQPTGRSVELPEEIFGAEPNNHVVYLAVKQYLASQRQGTHKVKTRAEVQGSSRKLHKQKGTGGSRKGNIRNPLYKGGGTIFGPKPHRYDIKLNRKVKDLAKISALSFNVSFDAPKTKQFIGIMNTLNVSDKKTLFIVPEYNETTHLSCRNIPNADAVLLSDVNTYEIVNAEVLVFTESAAKIFSEEETAEEA